MDAQNASQFSDTLVKEIETAQINCMAAKEKFKAIKIETDNIENIEEIERTIESSYTIKADNVYSLEQYKNQIEEHTKVLLQQTDLAKEKIYATKKKAEEEERKKERERQLNEQEQLRLRYENQYAIKALKQAKENANEATQALDKFLNNLELAEGTIEITEIQTKLSQLNEQAIADNVTTEAVQQLEAQYKSLKTEVDNKKIQVAETAKDLEAAKQLFAQEVKNYNIAFNELKSIQIEITKTLKFKSSMLALWTQYKEEKIILNDELTQLLKTTSPNKGDIQNLKNKTAKLVQEIEKLKSVEAAQSSFIKANENFENIKSHEIFKEKTSILIEADAFWVTEYEKIDEKFAYPIDKYLKKISEFTEAVKSKTGELSKIAAEADAQKKYLVEKIKSWTAFKKEFKESARKVCAEKLFGLSEDKFNDLYQNIIEIINDLEKKSYPTQNDLEKFQENLDELIKINEKLKRINFAKIEYSTEKKKYEETKEHSVFNDNNKFMKVVDDGIHQSYKDIFEFITNENTGNLVLYETKIREHIQLIKSKTSELQTKINETKEEERIYQQTLAELDNTKRETSNASYELNKLLKTDELSDLANLAEFITTRNKLTELNIEVEKKYLSTEKAKEIKEDYENLLKLINEQIRQLNLIKENKIFLIELQNYEERGGSNNLQQQEKLITLETAVADSNNALKEKITVLNIKRQKLINIVQEKSKNQLLTNAKMKLQKDLDFILKEREEHGQFTRKTIEGYCRGKKELIEGYEILAQNNINELDDSFVADNKKSTLDHLRGAFTNLQRINTVFEDWQKSDWLNNTVKQSEQYIIDYKNAKEQFTQIATELAETLLSCIEKIQKNTLLQAYLYENEDSLTTQLKKIFKTVDISWSLWSTFNGGNPWQYYASKDCLIEKFKMCSSATLNSLHSTIKQFDKELDSAIEKYNQPAQTKIVLGAYTTTADVTVEIDTSLPAKIRATFNPILDSYQQQYRNGVIHISYENEIKRLNAKINPSSSWSSLFEWLHDQFNPSWLSSSYLPLEKKSLEKLKKLDQEVSALEQNIKKSKLQEENNKSSYRTIIAKNQKVEPNAPLQNYDKPQSVPTSQTKQTIKVNKSDSSQLMSFSKSRFLQSQNTNSSFSNKITAQLTNIATLLIEIKSLQISPTCGRLSHLLNYLDPLIVSIKIHPVNNITSNTKDFDGFKVQNKLQINFFETNLGKTQAVRLICHADQSILSSVRNHVNYIDQERPRTLFLDQYLEIIRKDIISEFAHKEDLIAELNQIYKKFNYNFLDNGSQHFYRQI